MFSTVIFVGRNVRWLLWDVVVARNIAHMNNTVHPRTPGESGVNAIDGRYIERGCTYRVIPTGLSRLGAFASIRAVAVMFLDIEEALYTATVR